MGNCCKFDVISIISDILEIEAERLSPELSIFNEPRWDSLAHLKIILAVQDLLGKKMSIDDIASISSVSDLLDIVTSYGKQYKFVSINQFTSWEL